MAATNTNGNAGRRFYKCANCANFQFLSPEAPAPPSTPETPGSSEFLVSEPTRRLLQALLEVPHGAGLGWGRDVGAATAPCDHLAVECAWHVHNPHRAKRYAAFRTAALAAVEAAAPAAAPPPLVLRDAHAAAASNLLAEAENAPGALESRVNEVLLLHGTKPEAVFPILWQGLDPLLAKDGLFGSGSYFAEDAAKVDQYCTVDKEWRGSLDHALQPLHRKLYERGTKHAATRLCAAWCLAAHPQPPATAQLH